MNVFTGTKKFVSRFVTHITFELKIIKFVRALPIPYGKCRNQRKAVSMGGVPVCLRFAVRTKTLVFTGIPVKPHLLNNLMSKRNDG